MYGIDPQTLKPLISELEDAAKKYYAGELPRAEYKGTSGRFGSYAQRGDAISMVRLRMTAGRLTKPKMKFIADTMNKYQIETGHFTTCEAIQLHDITSPEVICEIVKTALDVNIVMMGGGGDNPRNVMCAPLTGVEKGEYFDVLPYAEAAADYLMNFLNLPKMPRKYKCCFSNSPKNIPHATFRDIGFVARKDGKFDIYTAGGVGPNPKTGVLCGEAVDPSQILYYCKALYETFVAYGNYEVRAKARTRYMQETLGGAEAYRAAYLEKLAQVYENEKLDLPERSAYEVTKQGCGRIYGPRVTQQKQKGLVAVEWHPIGGLFNKEDFTRLYETIKDMEGVELRIAPFESVYIINLTAAEARKVLAVTADSNAESLFETSLACIGGSRCQQGQRDSQALLRACIKAVREAEIPDGALPKVHISGCPSSCTSQQAGVLGFRGHNKKVNGKVESAFLFYADGCELQGKEVLSEEKGAILETQVPAFLVELGKAVANTGLSYAKWRKAYPGELERIAAPYLA